MQTFLDTISTGIQDVSALLPLLGTDQCERHVGTALEKGFLYAAATPLSVFGSLGIVRTSFATLFATITHPFYGGNWLDDAGFVAPESAAAMITVSRGTKKYGAEVNLEKLMKDQHINDPELVLEIEWSGWGEDEASSILFSWNLLLILTSALSAVMSLSPYVYLIHGHWDDPLSWTFPLLRSGGAFICVVTVQLALQLRIHHIVKSSLLLMKVERRHPQLFESRISKEQRVIMERRLAIVVDYLSKSSDVENGHDDARDRDALTACKSLRSLSSWSLLLLRVLLAAGMFMIVAGYVGCFNLVNKSGVDNGPYVWLGMEAFLSILRIFLWGWNPAWDDHSTGMTMKLKLHDRGSPGVSPVTSSKLGTAITPTPGADRLFPLITTPHRLSRLSPSLRAMGGRGKDQKEGFIIESAENFLPTATSYVGPLRLLKIENISLFYSIVPHVDDKGDAKKLLCTTARHSGSSASISIITGGGKPIVYSSHCDELLGTRALQATLEKEITDHSESIDVLDLRTFEQIVEHSNNLFSKLLGDHSCSNHLDLLWTVSVPSHVATSSSETARLTKFDEEYIRLCQTYDLKGDICSQRGTHIIGVFSDAPPGSLRYGLLVEYGVVMESAILEIYLCRIEHEFTQTQGLPPATSRRLVHEWVRKMQGRIGVERRQCEGRSSDLPAEVAGTWDSLAHELRELRLLSSDSPFLQKWRDLLDTLLTTEGPNVSELFELRPFSKMRHLKNALLPVFTMNGTTKIQTEMYHKMLASLRPTLQILHNSHHSPDLFDRVDIYGPSSAHFSPPHMSIRNSTKDDLSKVLAKQAHLIRTMQFRSISLLPLLDQLKTLDSHPQPLVALTTLNFRDVLEETFSDQVVKSITSILRKNHTIVCLGFDDCCYIDDAVLDRFQEAIQSNRKEWVQRAVAAGHDEVIYHAGIQMSSGKEHNTLHLTGDGAFSIFQEDVFLTPGGEIYVLVYIPSSGKIVPSMWLMLDDVDYVTAKLQRLTGKVEDGIFGAEESVSALLSSRLDLRGIPRVERVGRCL